LGGETCTGFWCGNVDSRAHWGDPDLNVMVILRWIFRYGDVGIWMGSSWLRKGQVAGTFE